MFKYLTKPKLQLCLQDPASLCGSTPVSLWNPGPASPLQPSKCKREKANGFKRIN